MKINKLLESKKLKEGITNTEPAVHLQGKSSHTFTKDKKWEVDVDEKGNILARTIHGKPYYFKGHINDKVNDFPSTDEDNIILAAREQHRLKFGNKEVKEGYSHFEFTSGANPYIAKDEKEKNRIFKKYGNKVKEIEPGFYKVDDSEKDLFRVDESKQLNETKYGKDELWNQINNNEWAYNTLSNKVKTAVEKGLPKERIVYIVRNAIFSMKDDFGRIPTTQAERLELARDFVEDELQGYSFEDGDMSVPSYKRTGNWSKLGEAFKPSNSGIQSVKCYNRYNYTIQELRVDNDKKTFERGQFTIGKPDKKTKNRQEFEDIVDTLKELGYTEIKSDYRSMRNKSRKGLPTNESKESEESELITQYINNGEFDKLEKVHNGTNVVWKLKEPISESDDKTIEFDDDIDDLTYYYDDELFKDNLENDPYTEIASKQVPDSDGFLTDYTMYRNINTGTYVFIFGDKDVYTPDNSDFDWECETEEEAKEWFDNYNGFDKDEFEDSYTEYYSLIDEDVDSESPILHKKANGSYLVASDNGYTAFNKSDECVGHISANNEQEAKNKFNSNQFDEDKDK